MNGDPNSGPIPPFNIQPPEMPILDNDPTHLEYMDPLEIDADARANFRLTDFTPHHRLYNDMCRLFEQSPLTPPGVLQHLSDACLIETDILPLQIQDALDEYHVSHMELPAFPFNDFIMMGSLGNPVTANMYPGVAALLDVNFNEKENEATAFTALSILPPGEKQLNTVFMGVRFKPGTSFVTKAWDLQQITGIYNDKGVLDYRSGGPVNRDIKDALSVWTNWIRQQLLYIDLPRHHVIVETPKSYRPRTGKVVKATRAPDKEKVRLIRPEMIRKVYTAPENASDGTLGSREHAPHFRRGHTKLLSSSKWKHKQGQRVVVRPTWVGPEDWEHKGLKYRVVRPNERT